MKAFTLIEVLVVVLIVGFLGLGITQVIANSNRVTNDSTRKVMLNANITRLMDDMGRDIHNGAKLESDGQTLTIINGDKTNVKWTVLNDKITRLNETGNSNTFLFIGVGETQINNSSNAFTTNIAGRYYKADISFDISVIEPSGTLTVPTITNTYFTRTIHSGILW